MRKTEKKQKKNNMRKTEKREKFIQKKE